MPEAVLILQLEWANLILEGTKTVEVRGTACTSKVGRVVYITRSGESEIVGSVKITKCEGPVDLTRFRNAEHLHLVNRDHKFIHGKDLPYKHTYLWHLSDAMYIEPFHFKRPRGAIVWAKYDGNTIQNHMAES